MIIFKQTNGFAPEQRRITVSARRFGAAWHFVGKDNPRYYLQGVYIEPHHKGGVTLHGTDGVSLFSILDPDGYIEGSGGWICPLPKTPFKKLVKQANAGHLHFVGNNVFLTDSMLGRDDVIGNPDFDPSVLTVRHMAAAFCPPIDGKYPDVRHLVPKASRAKARDFTLDPAHLARYLTALQILNPYSKPGLRIHTPGCDTEAVVIRSPVAPEFLGAIAPMRNEQGNRLPDWFSYPRKKRKAANDTASTDAAETTDAA